MSTELMQKAIESATATLRQELAGESALRASLERQRESLESDMRTLREQLAKANSDLAIALGTLENERERLDEERRWL